MLALLLGTCIAVALLLTLAVITNRIINILFRFENFLERRGSQTLVKPVHALKPVLHIQEPSPGPRLNHV